MKFKKLKSKRGRLALVLGKMSKINFLCEAYFLNYEITDMYS